MKVAVVGSRNTKVNITKHMPGNIELIISGGASGIDTLAQDYAKKHNIPTLIILPDYEKYGKAAPLKRNEEIVNKADVIIAFWDMKSKGTEHIINYAKSQNKKVILHKVLNLKVNS